MCARFAEPTSPIDFAGDVAFLKVGQRGSRASWAELCARVRAGGERLGREGEQPACQGGTNTRTPNVRLDAKNAR